jgi:hypothetical protein
LLLWAALPVGGCHEGEIDGAVVRRVWINGPSVFPGDECTVVRLGTNGAESRLEAEIFAFHGISERGKVRLKVYIRPEGAPSDFELTVDNGELARDLSFNRASFVDVEVLRDTVVTHEDDVIDLYHFFTEDCEDIEYPDGLGR